MPPRTKGIFKIFFILLKIFYAILPTSPYSQYNHILHSGQDKN